MVVHVVLATIALIMCIVVLYISFALILPEFKPYAERFELVSFYVAQICIVAIGGLNLRTIVLILLQGGN